VIDLERTGAWSRDRLRKKSRLVAKLLNQALPSCACRTATRYGLLPTKITHATTSMRIGHAERVSRRRLGAHAHYMPDVP